MQDSDVLSNDTNHDFRVRFLHTSIGLLGVKWIVAYKTRVDCLFMDSTLEPAGIGNMACMT